MTTRAKLSNREIALLLHVQDRAGLCGRTTLPPRRRTAVPTLWRRHLVEIWYRCAPDEGCAHGPYFNLTAEGYQLACAIQAARAERQATHSHLHCRSRPNQEESAHAYS